MIWGGDHRFPEIGAGVVSLLGISGIDLRLGSVQSFSSPGQTAGCPLERLVSAVQESSDPPSLHTVLGPNFVSLKDTSTCLISLQNVATQRRTGRFCLSLDLGKNFTI